MPTTIDVKLRQRLTIVITTKNRWGDLLETLRVLETLGLQACPIIVIDDGSDSLAPEPVLRHLGKHRLIRFDHSEGLVAQRNRLGALAATDYMLSIDDDSAPLSVNGLNEVINRMDSDQAIGAVALPVIFGSRGEPTVNRPKWSETRSYIGCGHIIRVRTFLEMGGYWSKLIYWGEERDYSLRLVAAGYKVVQSPQPVIHHRIAAAGRSSVRLCYFRGRNTLLIWYYNAPKVLVPWILLRSIIGILGTHLRDRQLFLAAGRGMLDAFRMLTCNKGRGLISSRMTVAQWLRWCKLA